MSPTERPAVVTARGLTKRYRSTAALDGVDLDLRPGITGLLGHNGAGKSTLIRLLTTSEPPTSGSVTLDGERVDASAQARLALRRSLGYLPQEVTFPRGMTCFAFVDYIAVLKEWDDTRARHAEARRVLDLVGLADRTTRRIRTLSGGQRRRLALAQALLGAPRVLVLDEPTTGLDPEQRASLRGLLTEASQNCAVLLATHQTEDVAALCERVVVLDGGRVRFAGPVTEFVGTATDKVWLDDAPLPGALTSWRTGTGAVRSVGGTPSGTSRPAEPGVEDAYLLMAGAPVATARSANQGSTEAAA